MLRGLSIAILMLVSLPLWAEAPPHVLNPVPRDRDARKEFFDRLSAGQARSVPRRRQARPPQKNDAEFNFDFLKLLGSGLNFGNSGNNPQAPASAGIPGVGLGGGLDFGNPSSGSDTSAGGGGSGNPGLSDAGRDGEKPQVNSVGFNDDAPEGRDSVELRGSDNGRSGPSLPPGEGTGTLDSVYHPLFKPVCFLIDPVNTNANSVIKDFVDAYASCGVTAVPFAFTIKQNYPDEPDLINELAKQVCPLSSVLGVNESSIQTHVQYDTTSDKMCDSWEDKEKGIPTKNVAGCALFVKPRHFTPDPKKAKDFSQNSSNHFGGSGSDGKDAVSIVDKGQDSMVAIHEVQHNNGGVNVGEGDGEKPHGYGIESVGNEPNSAGSGNSFTGEGCAHIRSASNPNDGTYMYSPSRSTYYVPVENPRYQRDLMAGRSFFDSGAGPPPLSPIPPNNNSELPLATAPPGKQEIVGGPPSKHKKKPQGGGPALVQAPARGKPSSLSESNSFFGGAGVPDRAGEEGANKIGFNDKADEGSEAFTKDFFGEGPTKRIGFNDKAPEDAGVLEKDFFKGGDAPGGEAPGGEAPGGEAPGGQAPGDAAGSRLLASIDDKKGGKKELESKLDKDFFEEEQRRKNKPKDPNGYDSTIRESGAAPAPKAQDIGALSSDTSLFAEDTSLFEKGASFIESVADKLNNFFDDSYFGDVKGEGQKRDDLPQERVRIIKTEDIY